ncbi:hypothetical protein FOZ61_002885 [Perkinsus olseni]|uniref:RRM domain-containing protein n=1 Tax=Perkinsus olseni TaxID=32597 RepID=A0A7J6M766_PEROL|nr:hypothetical protein FOZ61_002885 [Perkinsus olseni]KAF4667412.1 hypothetical protein FOL46_002551 [Perkinsus olseni]
MEGENGDIHGPFGSPKVRRNSVMRVCLKNSSFHFEEAEDEICPPGELGLPKLRTRSRSESDILAALNNNIKTPVVAEFHPDTGELIPSIDFCQRHYANGTMYDNLPCRVPFVKSDKEEIIAKQQPGSTTGDFDWYGVTTLMVRNIPSRYSPRNFRQLISTMGFGHSMDFFYMPMDSVNNKNLGYAFINLVNEEEVARFIDVFVGYKFDAHGSEKVCVICPARVQGFRQNVNHFQNAGTRFNIPDAFKPMAIENGEAVPIHGCSRRNRFNSFNSSNGGRRGSVGGGRGHFERTRSTYY